MRDLRDRLIVRGALAGVVMPDPVLDRLMAYLELLARWSRRINLTAFDLSTPSDQALDRLLVEPVAAATLVRSGGRRALDIGSGGGSPAVPLMIASTSIEIMTMVEVRARKAAFLREVVRELGLPARVEVARVEDVAASGGAGGFEVVTFRAVRADSALWRAVDQLLAPNGLVLWFGGYGHSVETYLVQVDRVATTISLSRR